MLSLYLSYFSQFSFLGNYISQYFGNFYLTYFDHYCKESLKLKYYYRYCDDIVILSENKKFLHETRSFNK